MLLSVLAAQTAPSPDAGSMVTDIAKAVNPAMADFKYVFSFICLPSLNLYFSPFYIRKKLSCIVLGKTDKKCIFFFQKYALFASHKTK